MNDEYVPKRRRRRSLTGCLVILVSLVLMVGVAWVFMSVLAERSDEAFKAKGYPTTLAELDAWYIEPPHGENAADFYLEAGTILAQGTFPDYDDLPIQGDAELPPVGTPMLDEMRAVIALFIDHEAAAFGLIDEGAQYEHARYPVQFALRPTALPIQHNAEVRNIVRAQMLRTLIHSGRGEEDLLVSKFETLSRVASSLHEEPILISQLVSNATTSLAVSTANRVLNENRFDTGQLSRIDAALARLLDDDGLLRAFIGERCFSSSMMTGTFSIPVVGGLYRAELLGTMDEFIALAEEGLPNRLDTYRDLQSATSSMLRPLSSVMTPAFIDNLRSYYETRASVLAARAAVTIQRLRLETGELPEGMDEVPESVRETWPVDPFSGNPLIYKRLDEGFVVYSVGGDMEDDGGMAPDADTDVIRARGVEDVRFRILK